MEKLKEYLKRSGYAQNELEEIEERVMERIDTAVPRNKTETITFPLFYFKGFNEFKKIITDFKPELQQIIGEMQIVMAVKKNPSIGNKFVQNKLLSMEETQLPNQKCNATNCSQCLLVKNLQNCTCKQQTCPHSQNVKLQVSQCHISLAMQTVQ